MTSMTLRWAAIGLLTAAGLALAVGPAAADEHWPRGGGVAPMSEDPWPRGSGVAPMGEEPWPRGSG
ncbi:hypothetical protein OIE67_16080 [Nonomuraea fuscirosea]|uniref:hypothetical protein n=1 Tax=Nonomuraea fuscirosea TaxID=1291556 RepID=UPI002DDA36CC|nr:hypothetical protein [Nonomuraea fuscirosea]WSA56060.1 hypothetical protein OIE67_16080 [Nonomuraea fuscirosea]